MTVVLLGVLAASAWYFSTLTQGVYMNYAGAPNLDHMTGTGLYIMGDYLEEGGFTLGYNQREILLTDATGISEDDLYAGLRLRYFNDFLSGRFTLHLDAHRIQDLGLTYKDRINVATARLSFLNHRNTYYADLGYARSNYVADMAMVDDLRVQQWTSSVGVPSGSRDWLQARGYYITHAASNRMAEMNSNRAAELKLTHRFDLREGRGAERLEISGLTGKRMFAVDPDSADVYSLTDLQRTAVAVGVHWRVSAASRVLTAVGQQSYEYLPSGQRYSGRYIYLNLSTTW